MSKSSKKQGEFWHKNKDFDQKIMFTYQSSRLAYKDKIRFYYALKGRDGKTGIIKDYDCDFISKGVFLAPAEHDEDIKKFFDYWKIPFKRRKIFIEK